MSWNAETLNSLSPESADGLKEKRNVRRYCNFCSQPFDAVEGDLERLCPECRGD